MEINKKDIKTKDPDKIPCDLFLTLENDASEMIETAIMLQQIDVYKNTIKEMNDVIKGYHSNVVDLSKQCKDLKKEIDEYEENINRFKKQIEEYKAKIDKLECTIDSYREVFKDLGMHTGTVAASSLNIPAWDSRGLEYNSWDTIKAYTKAGLLSTVAKVGDTKSFTYNGQTLHAQLVGIGNNNDNVHSNYYPLGTADFITVECLNAAYKMNSSESYFSNNGGWRDQPLRTTLNTTIYNALPSDLKDVIINKEHTYDCGQYSPQSSSGSSWSWQKSYQSLSDKLWLPTLVEVGLSAYNGRSDHDSTYNAKYSVFTDDNSRIKKVNGSADYWWLSSPFNFASASDEDCSRNFTYVHDDGSWNFGYVSYLIGVPICFRI